MQENIGAVEVYGLDECEVVNDAAKSVVKNAGYDVVLTTLSRDDLLYIGATLGVLRLPAVRQGHRVWQGLTEIREHFGPQQ